MENTDAYKGNKHEDDLLARLNKLETNEERIEALIKEYSINKNISDEIFNNALESYTAGILSHLSKKKLYSGDLFDIIKSKNCEVLCSMEPHSNYNFNEILDKIKIHKFTGLLKIEHNNTEGYLAFKDGKINMAVSNEVDLFYDGYPLKRVVCLEYIKGISNNQDGKLTILGRYAPEDINNILEEGRRMGFESDDIESEKVVKRRTRFSLECGTSPSTEEKDENTQDYLINKAGLAEELRLERCSKMLAAVVLLPDDKERLRILMSEGITPTDFSYNLKNAVEMRKEKDRTNEISPAEKAAILEDELVAELAELEGEIEEDLEDEDYLKDEDGLEDEILKEIEDLEDL